VGKVFCSREKKKKKREGKGETQRIPSATALLTSSAWKIRELAPPRGKEGGKKDGFLPRATKTSEGEGTKNFRRLEKRFEQFQSSWERGRGSSKTVYLKGLTLLGAKGKKKRRERISPLRRLSKRKKRGRLRKKKECVARQHLLPPDVIERKKGEEPLSQYTVKKGICRPPFMVGGGKGRRTEGVKNRVPCCKPFIRKRRGKRTNLNRY